MRHTTVATFAALALTIAAAGPVGCGRSSDTQLIHSTRANPHNVSVVDTVDARTLWRMEVPAGYELELDFADHQWGATLGEPAPPSMSWSLSRRNGVADPDAPMPAETRGRIALPGKPVRIDVQRRDTLDGSTEVFRYDAEQ